VYFQKNKEMIRVVHLNANSAGGAFVTAQRLNKALNAVGDVVSTHLVYTGQLGDYTLWANNPFKKAIAFGLHAIEKLQFLQFEKNKSVRFAFSHGRFGIDITKNPLFRNADIVHLHWINKGFISLAILEKILGSGKKIVWTCHDMWPFTGGCYHNRDCDRFQSGCGHCPYLKKPSENDLSASVFNYKAQMYSENAAIQFVTPSAWLANKARESSIISNPQITVIPNGINLAEFQPHDREPMRKRLGILEDEKLLLFAAANLSNPFKGFAEFNAMLDGLAAEYNGKVSVVIIGENKSDTQFSTTLPIQFTGYVSDSKIMADLYNAADVYVTTSLEENLPTTIMESMACGTPVAAFSVGGIPEMIIHGKNGVLAKLKDSASLAKSIGNLFLMESAESIQMRADCRATAENTWSESIIAERYKSLYLEEV
jgi:glycosyltransferase involved in cell wall biosynthesis